MELACQARRASWPPPVEWRRTRVVSTSSASHGDAAQNIRAVAPCDSLPAALVCLPYWERRRAFRFAARSTSSHSFAYSNDLPWNQYLYRADAAMLHTHGEQTRVKTLLRVVCDRPSLPLHNTAEALKGRTRASWSK